MWLELLSAWRGWWDGASVNGYPLWGHDVLFWGRVGKFLQFLAGLVVVLDLISPERLRARGAAARRELALRTARWRRQKAANHAERTREILVIRLIAQSSVEGSRTWPAHTRGTVPYFLEWLPERELRDWIRDTQSVVNPGNWSKKAFVSGRTKDLGERDQAIVEDRIRVFLRAQLKPYEYAAWRAFGPRVNRRRMLAALAWISLAIGIVFTMRVGLQALEPGLGGLVSTLTSCTSTVAVMMTVAATTAGGGLFITRLIRLPGIGFYTAIANILHSARPGHKLRWLGLFLFVIGFGFDLLAS